MEQRTASTPARDAAPIDWRPLVEAALAVRERAHAPFSRFRVGAALLADDGSVYAGCNVENRTYGLTICAERSAIVQMVAAGARRPRAIAVVTESQPPAPPCGMCRETLAEFADDLPVLLVGTDGARRETRLSELFPEPFEFEPP